MARVSLSEKTISKGTNESASKQSCFTQTYDSAQAQGKILVCCCQKKIKGPSCSSGTKVSGGSPIWVGKNNLQK